MPLDLNKPHGQVSGATSDECRYIQNGVRYQANHEVCEGSVDPDVIPEEKVVRTAVSMAEEAAELTRRAQTATNAANAQAALENSPVDNQQPEVDPELKPDPTDDDELPIVDQLDGDIGKSDGSPYATESVAKRAIGGEEGLNVVRVANGFLLRRAA